MVEKMSETAMKPGAVDVGAVTKRGVPEGSWERSYVGEKEAEVQLKGESLSGREQEPVVGVAC